MTIRGSHHTGPGVWTSFTRPGPCRARLAFGLLSLALLAVLGGCGESSTPATNDSPAVPVWLADVESRTLQETVRGIGTLRAKQTVEVRPETSGTIRSRLFREGERVSAGEVLFELDVRKLQQQLAAAEAALESAEARKDDAERMGQTERLFRDQVATEDDLDEARNNLRAARSDVQRLESESDSRNGRIQVFSHQGEFLRIIGEPGNGPGQLGRPMDLAIHQGNLYVADFWHDQITVFSLSGQFIRHIGEAGNGPGQFNGPGGVTVARDGSLYVADFYNQRVQRLDPDGQLIEQWGTTGEIGIRAGEFNYPTDVSLAREGELLVADGYNDRIQVFRPSGEILRKWGGPLALNISGGFSGWFATVSSVTVGPEDNIFAADFYNHRVQKFSPGGKFLTAFGEHGNGPGQFDYITAASVAPDGTVFTTDFGNNRVLSWKPSNQ